MKTKRIKAVSGVLRDMDGTEVLSRWTLPADDESYERMVEQVALAIATSEGFPGYRSSYLNAATAAIRAIGITNPATVKRDSTKGRK